MSISVQKIVNTSVLPQAILQEVPSFGYALLINDTLGAAGVTFKEYTDYDSVLSDYADTTETAKTADSYFGNLPNAPQRLYILTYDSTVALQVTEAKTVAAENSKLYYPIIFNLNVAALVEVDWVSYADTNRKIVLINIADIVDVQAGSPFEPIASNKRVVFCYHSNGDQNLSSAVAAIYGNSDLSAPNANISFAFITFVSLLPDLTINDAIADTLEQLNVNYYAKIGTTAITYPGRSASGEALNSLQQEDYIKDALDIGFFNVILSAAQSGEAITFDSPGFQLLASAANNICQGFYNDGRGFLSPFTLDGKFYKFGYKVTMPDPTLALPADKQNGIVKGIEIVLSTKENILKLTPTVQLV